MNGSILAPGATLKEISTEFQFTEGPAADAQGNVYFTDQPNDRIMVYTVDGKLKTFMQPAGRANGMYFDRAGFLIACADEHNELWQIDVKTKRHSVLMSQFDGKPLNGPNDVWVAPNGDLYITDPFYKRPWWDHTDQPQTIQGVYLLKAGGGAPVRVVDDFEKPNGIVGSPDGKRLYISDIGAGFVYGFDIVPDGMLTNKQLLCRARSDGMTMDCHGNVYVTNDKGVTAFSPAGEQLANIPVPQKWTANVTFGGPNRTTLFITAGTGFYSMQMSICGAQ
ncbi:MAG: SMP-30/gluconolactonase/LRE family protein [Planctomycetaceae bacterium]|nr:SMP-30/gluconolactonase/LRE family protein [Planctomycetaceae bacterium]